VRIVADIGNSRLKWGRLGPDGRIVETVALPIDEPAAWDRALESWGVARGGSSWAVASVNPPLAERLLERLDAASAAVRLLRSAADVPLTSELEEPERAGVDRALAVLAAVRRMPEGVPGQVVSCGSAITVERVSASGVWLGGAIAPGLGLAARALHQLTAQLPFVPIGPEVPPPWGTNTESALRAGLFWGAVGAVRELLVRQGEPTGWVVWTGGDAATLALHVLPGPPLIVPDLVLEGLAAVAFPPGEPS
jgi:type III pantothenate kinase